MQSDWSKIDYSRSSRRVQLNPRGRGSGEKGGEKGCKKAVEDEGSCYRNLARRYARVSEEQISVLQAAKRLRVLPANRGETQQYRMNHLWRDEVSNLVGCRKKLLIRDIVDSEEDIREG